MTKTTIFPTNVGVFPQQPDIHEENRYGEPMEIHRHPAFGTITLSEPTGGDRVLFGSDLQHNHRIRIRVHAAYLERRKGGGEKIHQNGNALVDFEMSHAQFAQFITSVGKGNGTPVTLRAISKESEIVEIPGIKKMESSAESWRNAIQQSAKNQVDRIQKELDRLSSLLEEGKTSKKELREIHHALTCHVSNLPSNMAHVVEQAETALEKATSDAKIQVESYMDMVMRRFGANSQEAQEAIAWMGSSENGTPKEIVDGNAD